MTPSPARQRVSFGRPKPGTMEKRLTSSRRVLEGAAWAYGVQVVTVVIQFAYAAVTSRSVDPSGFGAYAVALSVTALVALVANGGLAQTVARATIVDKSVIRGLATYGLLLGLVGAFALWLSADAWAALWGEPAAAEPIRWLCLSTLIAPYLGLASGLMRRLGKFRALAVATLTANVVGMAAGALSVYMWRTASSLLVSPMISQVVILAGCLLMSDRLLYGLDRLGAARGELGFSVKVLITTVVYYLSGNAGKWSASVGLGAAALGSWNRADVVSTVPFQQVQAALTQAIYPEFRHDRDGATRAKRVWPDLLGLVAWVALPTASVAAVILPVLVPLLFGDGWQVAAAITAPLALVGGLQILASLLASALEAIGRFRWIFAAQIVLVAVNVTAAFVAVLQRSWFPILAALILGIVLQHGIHVVLSTRAGYLDVRVLSAHYVAAATTSLGVAGLAWGLLQMAVTGFLGAWLWPVYIIFGTTVVGLLWVYRWRVPPISIARRFGILR